jgi:aminoglycoside 2'-N-acetyltransferase I
MTTGLEVRTRRTFALERPMRDRIVTLCVEAHDDDDFARLFEYLPPDALHVLAQMRRRIVGHAVVTNRWLQVDDGPLLRTAYVDAVAVSPDVQRGGVGSAVLRHVARVVSKDFDVACLETDRVGFYERLGWEEWLGPLAGRSPDGLVPTPDQRGVMVLRLPRTPTLDLAASLSIEASRETIW